MTIKRGQSWGERRRVPDDLAVAHCDAEAAALIAAGCREFLLTGGDMWRTIGGSSVSESDPERTVLTLDSLVATYRHDNAVVQQPLFAHAVLTTSEEVTGSSLTSWVRRCRNRKTTTYVMNAQFLGSWDLIPRGHPNDGKFEVLTISAAMPWRQRREFRRRLPTGTHIPHPLVHMHSITSSWHASAQGTAIIDGTEIGVIEDLTVTIGPDSLTVWI